MNGYFKLQAQLIYNRLFDIGLTIIGGMLFFAGLFVGLSVLLFKQLDWAVFIYVPAALYYILRLGTQTRTDFIKTYYTSRSFYKIRLVENGVCTLPFLIVLLVHQQWIASTILSMLSVILVFLKPRIVQFALPTPFNKRPFEFIIGFRKTFYLYPLLYAVSAFAVYAKNVNIGLFTIIALVLISGSFYSKPEPDYYLSQFGQTASHFLKVKLKDAALHFTILGLPIFIFLLAGFWQEWDFILLLTLLSYLYLAIFVLAKYTAFPNEVSAVSSLFLALSLSFPPLLLVVLPMLYKKSKTVVKQYIDDWTKHDLEELRL